MIKQVVVPDVLDVVGVGEGWMLGIDVIELTMFVEVYLTKPIPFASGKAWWQKIIHIPLVYNTIA